MNGQPLPRAHGGPVRVVVPGYIGAQQRQMGHHNHSATRALGKTTSRPSTIGSCRRRPTPTPWRRAKAFRCRALPLNCDILVPGDGEPEITAGPLTIRGWAIAGDGRTSRVSTCRSTVAGVGAKPTWAGGQPVGVGASGLCTVNRNLDRLNVTARAWDDTGVTHPESPASLWNPRGYGNNAWAHIKVVVA